MCMRLTFIPWSIEGLPSSQALPGLLITAPPSVLVPAVLGALAVWIKTPKKKIECSACTRVAFLARDSSRDTQVYNDDGHGGSSGRIEAFPQEPARATGPRNMAHHRRQNIGLYPLSPCICATYSASVFFPVPRNARHTCQTQGPVVV